MVQWQMRDTVISVITVISRGLYTDFTNKAPGCGLYTGAAYTRILFSKMGRFGNFMVSYKAE